MFYRYALTAIMVAGMLTGCARQSPENASVQPFHGPTQVNVSHIVTRTDDGSDVFVTVDGKEAGELVSGEDKQIHLPPGKHEVGGYVPTLFGLGRVTIQPVTVTTQGEEIKNIAYTVAKDRPEFTEIRQLEG